MLRLYSSEFDFHTHYMARLAAEARAGFAEALDRMTAHGARFAGLSHEATQATQPTLIDALGVCAAEHGFEAWAEFEAHCEAIAAGSAEEPSIAFYHNVEGNQLEAVASALDADPTLANTVSSTGKAALHKAQTREMAELLLDRGADPEQEATAAGSTGIMHAIFWGFTEVADAVGARCRAPHNLRVAAGLGDLAAIEACFDGAGELTPAARAGRDYYRPNYGWYPWSPSDNAQEVLDEALILAGINARVDAMAALRDRGADVNGGAFDSTALIRAASKGHTRAVEWLIAEGAEANATGRFGGHAMGVTALHIAASAGADDSLDLLIGAGGDLTLRDDLYNGTPEGWARQNGFNKTADRLKAQIGHQTRTIGDSTLEEP